MKESVTGSSVRCTYMGYISRQLKARPIIRLSNSLYRYNSRVIKQIKQKRRSCGNPERAMKNRVTSSHPESDNRAYYLWYLIIYQVLSEFHFFLEYSKFWKMQMIRDTTRIIHIPFWFDFRVRLDGGNIRPWSIAFRSRALLRAIWHGGGLMIHFHDILFLVQLHENNLGIAPF